jgi:type IV pilus assembly protein PilC
MPTFSFTARDTAGQWHKGTEAAADLGALAGALRTRGWSLVKAQASAGAAATTSQRRRGFLSPGSLDIEIGLSMMANMLDGGLTLLSSLKTCADQARRPSMARVWDDVHDKVAGGMPFADALEAHKKVFPKLVIQMARAGESSGTLEIVLQQAADQLERKRNLMVTVMSAMMYPAFTSLVAVGVGSYLVLKIIPEISKFLTSSGKKLPAMTQALIDFSAFCNNYLLMILIVLGSLVAAVLLGYQFPPAARLIDKTWLRVPIVGKLLKLSGTTMFARGLGMLIEAGVPVLSALETAGALVKNTAISARVADARRAVLAGNPLAKQLALGNEFMPMLPRMVAVGEETGTLSSVLIKVAVFHEKQLESYVKRMTLLIEPVMTLIVGTMVGFVYLAFFMAIYSV